MSEPTKKDNLSDKMAPGGINDGFAGPVYQLKLVEAFACVAFFNDYDFELSTENDVGGKFDDLVFKIKSHPNDSGIFPRFRLLQAKLKNSPKPLELNSILHHKDFELHKYFLSYLEIKDNFTEIQDLIIATANTFKDIDGPRQTGHEKQLIGHIHLKQVHDPDPFLGNIGVRYKLVCDKTSREGESTLEAVKNFLICKELIDVMYLRKLKNRPLLLAYKKFIMENILNETSMEFKDKFLDKSEKSIRNFRLAFKCVFDNNKSSFDKHITISGKFWEYIAKNERKQFLLNFFDDAKKNGIGADEVGRKERDEVNTKEEVHGDVMDNHIIKFLQKFTLLLDAKTEKIDNHIIEVLQRQNSKRNVVYGTHLESTIRKWITDMLKPKCIITVDDIKKCLDIVDSTYDKNSLEFHKSELLKKYTRIVFQLNLDSDFASFLLNEKNKFIFYHTRLNDSSIVCVKIIQILEAQKKDFIYLKSSSSHEAFEKGIKEYLNICIIEIEDGAEFFIEYQIKLEEITQNDPSMKIIIVGADTDIVCDPVRYQFVELNEVLCSEVTEDTLNHLLHQKVLFQGHFVQLSDLIQADTFMCSLQDINLSDLTNISQKEINLVSEILEFEFYISRNLIRRRTLKSEVVDDWKRKKFTDELTFSEKEFNEACNKFPKKDIHWLEKIDTAESESRLPNIQYNQDGDEIDNRTYEGDSNEFVKQDVKYKWIRTKNKISTINRYLDIKIPDESEETSLLDLKSRVFIISAVPGMGKSSMFVNLCRNMISKCQNFWIIKINLNGYTEVFHECKEMESIDHVLIFLSNEILKLKNQLEKKLFEFAVIESGNCFIVFDGFDEIARDYREVVLSIISLLINQSKCYVLVSTRPEWKDMLEDKFSEISYSIVPFTEENQKSFLIESWKSQTTLSGEDLKEIADSIMSISAKMITRKDESFSGIPLITKLLGSYLSTKVFVNGVTKAEIVKKLESESFNLTILFDNFIDNLINRHLLEKAQMQDTNVRVRTILKNLRSNLRDLHVSFALTNIFNESELKILAKCNEVKYQLQITDADREELLNCGLVYKFNDQLKFLHKAFPEHLVSSDILKNFGKESYAKFWLFNVSKYEGYKAIRSFINQSIKNHAKEQDQKLYGKLILQESEKIWALHLAAKEQNANLFEFLLNSILCYSESDLTQVKKILLSVDNDGVTLFYNYFRYCDISTKVLEAVLNILGQEFFKNVIILENLEENSVIGASRGVGENIIKLLHFILNNFTNDLKFLENVFCSTDINGLGILHISGECNGVQTIPQLLDILDRYKEIGDERVVYGIITRKSKYVSNFLSYLSEYWTPDCICEVLTRIKKLLDDDANELMRLFLDLNKYGGTFLNSIVFSSGKKKFLSLFSKILNWIKDEIGIQCAEKFLRKKDRNGRTFLFVICANDDEDHAADAFVATMSYLKNDVGLNFDFLKWLIFEQDNFGDSILHYHAMFYKKQFLLNLLSKALKWIKVEFGMQSVEDILQKKNKYGRTFLHLICYKDEKNHSTNVLIGILNYILRELEVDPSILLKLLLDSDKDSNSILHLYASLYPNKLNFFEFVTKFFPWICENYSLTTLKTFVLKKKSDEENFLFCIFVLYDTKIENFTFEGFEAFLKILDYCFELFGDKQLLTDILNSKTRNKTLIKYVKKKCVENGFNESLETFNQLLEGKYSAQPTCYDTLEIETEDESETYTKKDNCLCS